MDVLTTSHTATNSAAMELTAMVIWCLKKYAIHAPANIIPDPLMDLRCDLSPAQYESTYP